MNVMWMRGKKLLYDAVECMLLLMENKHNWVISKDKLYLIKLRGMRKPAVGKVAFISNIGDTVVFSLILLERRFSFRHLRFIPHIMVLNAPLQNIEFLDNITPEFGFNDSDDSNVGDVVDDVSYM